MAVQTTEERELIRAQARYVRSSARKARLVLEHIRGLPATDAQAVLQFQTRAVARDAGKVLKSAIANAENNSGHDADELIVISATADEGPTLKRWRARARGRVNRIRKRTCHITIVLSPALPGEIKPKRERPVRAPRTTEPAVEATETEGGAEAAEAPAEGAPKPKRRTRKAAAAEPETAETPDEPEAEAADEHEAEPEAAAEPEADEPAGEPEPEAAAEPEAEPEPEAAAEPEAEAAADEPEADAETEPEPEAAGDETPNDDEEATT